jgi:flagellar FliJ protein
MQALHTLLEREEAERDQALKRLQHAEELARRARAQAEMLHGYRDEYRQRWSVQFERGGSMSIVQCYLGFMQRLQQAITQQQRDAEQAAARAQQCRAELATQQLRVASVRKLIERRQHEVQRAAARREQKLGDEIAARTAARTLAAWPAAGTATNAA